MAGSTGAQEKSLLDDELLTDFMRDFYGYGSLAAPYWFIGMEEGGGDDWDEIVARLLTWYRRGRRMIEDAAEYHIAFGRDENFRKIQPVRQRTWAALIRVLFAIEGRAVTPKAILNYQQNEWGRVHGNGRIPGNVCLLELLPLPAPHLDSWIYPNCSEIPFLETRAVYRRAMAPIRIEKLKALVAKHRPRAVIFYGRSYRQYWNRIADPTLLPVAEPCAEEGKNDATYFISMHHPAARGVRSAYFDAIGTRISGVISAQSN